MIWIFKTAKLFDRFVEKSTRYAVIFAIAIIMILLALGIFVRLVPVFSMAGYDEIIEFLFAWMTFLGTVALWRQGSLFKVELLRNIPLALAKWIHLAVNLCLLLFAVVFTWWGWIFAMGATETTPFLMLPKKAWFFAMPVTGALMTIYALAFLIGRSANIKNEKE
jgi:TRAP-type C4-dicarboxylate transport system permease small subunit